MLVGIGFVAVLTGAIAERFIAPTERRVEAGEQDLSYRLDSLGERLARIESRLPGPE